MRREREGATDREFSLLSTRELAASVVKTLLEMEFVSEDARFFTGSEKSGTLELREEQNVLRHGEVFEEDVMLRRTGVR
jgi:hypothetical protein